MENEYARIITALDRAGILARLPQSGCPGVMGSDGTEYPVPTHEQVQKIFVRNRDLTERKIPQGFSCLELTPLAMPAHHLIDRMETSILCHGSEKTIFQARGSADEPQIPVRVNAEKHVWIWENLQEALDAERLVYFPKEYSDNHRGMTRSEVIHNPGICAVPGWSVGLVESNPFQPEQGEGKTLGGRKQLEIGLSPNEYLRVLESLEYAGETGKTLEDFMTSFLTRLETTGEVSNDVDDNNALWCLAQYLRVPYAQLVPTGRWHRKVGRVRLDMHRSNNKQCTKSWGGATIVRLAGG